MERVDVELDVLSKNDGRAEANRRRVRRQGSAMLNLISSPGAGKTTLLERSVKSLSRSCDVCVVEGDQQTDNDARRIKAAGARAVQVNTLDGCHLEANQVDAALDLLEPEPGGIVFIENVGNLVCPVLYDLGETARVVIASVTEGEDKPLKYPRAFETAQLCLVTKGDLLPYLDFDYEEFLDNIHATNPRIEVIPVGVGQDERWEAWVRAHARRIAQEAGIKSGKEACA